MATAGGRFEVMRMPVDLLAGGPSLPAGCGNPSPFLMPCVLLVVGMILLSGASSAGQGEGKRGKSQCSEDRFH